MWLGVSPRMDTRETSAQKETGLCVQNMITILNSIINTLEATGMIIQRARVSL